MSTTTEHPPDTADDPGGTHARSWSLAIVVAVVVVIAGAVVFATRSGASKPVVASIQATEQEYSINLSAASAPAGRISFSVHNNGSMTHELVAFRTDLDAAALPMGKDGKVDESAAGMTHIDPEAEDVAPGQTKTVVMDLSPGRYVFICNLVGHYQQGMRQVLVVR